VARRGWPSSAGNGLDEPIDGGDTSKKLSITNLRVGNLDPAAGWAAFNYMMEGSPNQVKGTNSIVFKKAGTDWQIALVHGAVDTKIGSH
jgi:hypothetical protein